MMKTWLFRILIILLVGLLAGGSFICYHLRDRHDGYTLDLDIKPGDPSVLKAGFTAVPINPVITDTWTDVNQDARYDPEDGDTFQDVNQNGQFDPVLIAGFHKPRPAQGIHDTLWARAMVIDDGQTKLGLVAIDAIGFGNDDVISVRKKLAETTQLDYVSVVATHTHEAPDLIGVWGMGDFTSGIDPAYLDLVINNTAAALQRAAEKTTPVFIRLAEDLTNATDLVTDSRPPKVMDPGLRLMQFIDKNSNATVGTLVAWANHPETTWSENLLISSDFVHYLREGIEKGIFKEGERIQKGLGGIAVYVNGAIGGLMTTDPDFPIEDPFRDTVYTEPSFAKAEAQGIRLAQIGLNVLAKSPDTISQANIRLLARSFEIPLDNKLYRLAAGLGVFKRGLSSWTNIRTEVSMWSLGPATFLMQPGEIYPEIINGGVEAPEGGDFAIVPIETTPLRSVMPGKYKFTIGLSNDLIGYIIPKSQWDTEAPFTYGQSDAPYGEINSLGPETGPIIYDKLLELIEAF